MNFGQKEFKMEPVNFEYSLDMITQNRKKWHKIQKSNCK